MAHQSQVLGSRGYIKTTDIEETTVIVEELDIGVIIDEELNIGVEIEAI